MRAHMDVIGALPELLAARSIEQVKDQIQCFIKAIGFDFFLIGIEDFPLTGAPQHSIETNYPTTCVEQYGRLQWLGRDPVVRHCRQSSLPLIWHQGHFLGDACQLHEESAAHGISTGVATALRGVRHSRAMMVSVANGACFNAKTQAWLTETMPVIHLLASYIYEAINRIDEVSASENIDLTRRESECLHWAAAGKTSWEISRILGCSEATVNFHFRNIIQKLGASNRRQAVVRALSLGLIRP